MLKNICIIVVSTVCFFWTASSYSFCVETNSGDGSLSHGVMSTDVCQSLLNTLEQQSGGTYMFRVQKNNGFYGKICNEKSQIKHFMATYAKRKGTWSCTKTDNPCGSLEENGVYRVDVSGGTYRLCTYK